MIFDAIQVNLILFSFCMFVSCLIMAFSESNQEGADRLKASIEYGIFSSTGLILAMVLAYGYVG
ncbi:hypothetical protein N480_15750 [Pseudoalteromonas luteoviolacea S2607]|uniref:hypothetical protein n=1 Tax=Pseudoalteromonas luteoviolacea TaxID=43657 RepID=UPI0007B062E9|nr:hypothetical protein [Pseudoalteromonas luteoviolacea]KZN36725.1 hypothetical protein N480_15750 [Pseudoalteromonas luteoviolacea S2607]